MATHCHIALLRGINVGGNNIIKMVDLRASFEAMGFAEVETYIQSGNVIFASKLADKTKLSRTIEKALSGAFSYDSRVMLVSAAELASVVAGAPPGFGQQPDRYRYDVLFVKAPLTPADVLEQITAKPGVDELHAGEHAVYFRRLISKAAQSLLPKLIQRPAYQSITIRNWNTTTKLLALVTSRTLRS